jgi:hypothetical protein
VVARDSTLVEPGPAAAHQPIWRDVVGPHHIKFSLVCTTIFTDTVTT